MSESKRYSDRYNWRNEPQTPQYRGAQQAPETDEDLTVRGRLRSMAKPFVLVWQFIDRAIPNIRTADGMAYALARRTPRTIVVCMVLLLAGVVASRLNIWLEGFLWGIPSLGAISMGVGFWVWSSNVVMRPDVSPDARAALQRAMRLQLIMVGAGILAIIYFLGMAAGWW